MPQVFVVDQGATFEAVALLGCNPKTKFGSQEQDVNSAGVPKWELEVVASFKDSFGKTTHETMKVGVAAPKNPADGLGMYTPVQLVNFVVGVMDKTSVDKRTGEIRATGAQIWYRCDAIRPAHRG